MQIIKNLKILPYLFFEAILLLAITSCTSRPLINESELAQIRLTRESEINKITAWSFDGRIAFRMAKESGSASLHWEQEYDKYQLRIIAPFGKGSFELSGDEAEVYLRTEQETKIRAKDPEELLEKTLGWSVPVNGLVYWVRGLPDPGILNMNFSLDMQGRISELEQGPWVITYKRYVNINGHDLPASMHIDNSQINLRLVIKNWIIPT